MALVVANVLGVGMIVPQAARLHRRRVVDGVSGEWVGVSLAINSWWIAYGVSEQLWGVVPVSVGAIVLYGVIAAQYVRLVGPAGARRIVVGVAMSAWFPLAFLLAGGWTAAGLAIGLAYTGQFAPAAITACRSVDLAGVSPATWAMATGEAAIWFTYGLSNGDVALLVGGGGGAVTAAVVLARVVTVGRARTQPALTAPVA
ncbi:MAG: hypothetical protein S0880_00945 [Actinomycetota bacterium]|nr:hypothetical protein [Actinomycetota bacterium]